VSVRRLTINDDGEFTAFWMEQPSGGSATLWGANADSAGRLSQGVVDAAYNNVQDSLVQVSARQFLYLYQASPVAPGGPIPAPPPGGYPTESKLLTMNSGGNVGVTLGVTAPSALQPSTPIVRDLSGNLSAIVANTTAPFPHATLAGNTQVTLLTPSSSPYATVEAQVFADFNSIAPRALWATRGKANGGDVLSMYVDQTSLTDGTFVPIGKVSNREVHQLGNTARFCPAEPDLVSTANAEFAVSWLEQNTALNGCDLVINGAVVNATGTDVAEFATSGASGGFVAAVWRESDPTVVPRADRIRFAQRGPGTGNTWTTPAAIDATYANAAVQQILAVARGPGGTLAVVWEPCEGTTVSCTTSVRLVSKFVGGVWSTKSIALGTSVAALAINAAGNGVLLAVGDLCSGVNCTQLSAYRF